MAVAAPPAEAARDVAEPGVLRLGGRLRTNARFRILGWFVLLMLLAIVASLVLQRTILDRRLTSESDRVLSEEAAAFRQIAQDAPRSASAEAIVTDYLDARPTGSGASQAYATFVAGRARDVDDRLHPVDPDWATLTRPERGWHGDARYLAVPLERDGRTAGVFVVARYADEARSAIDDALETGALVSLSVLAVTALIAWAMAGRVLEPVRLVTETAREIGETDFRRRITVTSGDEVGQLASTFNAMLDRLESAFETQRAFVHDAGHELRTPITVIRGHLELLGDDPDERRETVALVTGELDRMARIVNDLLLLAKAERPGFLRTEPVDVTALLREVEAKATALADRRWRVEAAPPVTPTIVADPQRLTQALMNLASNSVEHTRVDDEIAFGAASRGDGGVRLWVRDTGAGIPEHEQEHIFERFARGRSERRRPQGAGLGLAIVRAIAEAHGGSVAVDSRPGAGATFTIELPGQP